MIGILEYWNTGILEYNLQNFRVKEKKKYHI